MKKHEHSGCTKKSLEKPHEVLLAAGLRQGETLLDIGSGSGYLSIAASEIVGVQGKVYALDIHAESLRTLRNELSESGITNIEPMAADVTNEMPLPEASVDVCLMSNVLHGFVANEETGKVMANVTRVLRKEGEIVIIDFKKIPTPSGPPVSIRLEPADVEKLIVPCGFAKTRQFDAGPYHYALVFKRT